MRVNRKGFRDQSRMNRNTPSTTAIPTPTAMAATSQGEPRFRRR